MGVFAQSRTWQRGARLALSQLACLGCHTGTGRICTAGRVDVDWSADYRFFSQDRWEANKLFDPILRGVLEGSGPSQPLVTALDDTHLRKTGTKTPGVAYRRDPLSPPFHTNFIRAQRFLQMSAMVVGGEDSGSAGEGGCVTGPARAIPIRYDHVPPVAKPGRGASPQEWKAYRRSCRRHNLSTAGVAAITQTRRTLDQDPRNDRRPLVVATDGSYTNQTVLKGLPARTILIGRIRKDAKFFYLPTAPDRRPPGKPRRYGPPAPTPEQLRQDPTVPWQEVRAYAAGKVHVFRVKTIASVLWAKAGPQRPLRLVVIAPVGYRLHAAGKLLYRQPAYLVCTDLHLPLDQLLQYYLWRWDIEVNHRDEKQIIGVGQAQVRAPRSVDRDPAFAVAAYAALLLASVQTYGRPGKEVNGPVPKWRARKIKARPTTPDLIQQLRRELWGQALQSIQEHSDHFVSLEASDTKCLEFRPPLAEAVLYAPTG
jgi:hypothetical protein